MAFGTAAYVSQCWLPATGKARSQVLVRLSWTGFPPARFLRKVSSSLHVRHPPFPGFLAQSRSRVFVIDENIPSIPERQAAAQERPRRSSALARMRRAKSMDHESAKTRKEETR